MGDGSTAHDVWTLGVVGPLTIRRGGRGVELRPKERSVLAAIAAVHPDAIDIDHLAELVWDAVPASARKSLHNHVARIRRVAPGVIDTDGGRYRLGRTVFVEWTAAGSATTRPFADLIDSPDVEMHRQRYRSLVDAEAERTLGDAVAGRITPELVAVLEALVIERPYREHGWYLLALAQAKLGRRREALLTYRAACERLADVGLGPGEALRSLEHRILAGTVESGPGMDGRAGEPAATPREPACLHPNRSEPFVGRDDELGTIDAVWAEVLRTGRPHAVVIRAPAGMGKTRLVDEFCARRATGPGWPRVVWGRHRDGVDRGYAGVAEAWGRVVHDEPELVARLGNELDGLRPLLPGLGRGSGPAGAASGHGRLVHSARCLVRELAATPTIWLVDDVQWASDDVLGLLEETLDGLDGRLLLVVTGRPLGSPVASAIVRLERIVPTTSITLHPLGVDELAPLFRTATPETAELVHERTGGLPLFVSEIARRLRLTGSAIGGDELPTSIRDWVEHLTSGLDEDSTSVLRTAAVVGAEADLDVVRACVDMTSERFDRACATLLGHGFLGLGDGRARFSHGITRDIVYDMIGPAAGADLHRCVAETLDPTVGTEGWAEPTERGTDHATLAHHYARAGGAHAEQAAEHALEAGRDDLALGAWSAAMTQFDRAAHLTRRRGRRAEALVGLGRAAVGSEQYERAVQALDAAMEDARLEGLALVEASAVLTMVGRAGRGAAIGAGDEAHVALLRRALDNLERRIGLDPQHPAAAEIVCDVERELALSLLLSDAAQERTALLRRSLIRARSLRPPHPAALANALLGMRYAKLAGGDLADRLADIDEVLALDPRTVPPETLVAAHVHRHEDMVRSGREGEADLDAATRLLDRYRDPYWSWAVATWRGLAALRAGDTIEAERLTLAASRDRPDIAEAAGCLTVNLVGIRLIEGRAADVIGALTTAVESYPHIPAYRAVLALCLAEAGHHHRAAEELAIFSTRDFENLPDDTNRFLALAVSAHVAATIAEPAAARTLIDLLVPFDGQWVVLNCYGGGGAEWGPVSHALARLADLLGRRTDAQRWYARAVDEAAAAPLVLARILSDRSQSRRRWLGDDAAHRSAPSAPGAPAA